MAKKAYIGCKIILAEPGPAPRDMGEHKEGTPGMLVTYPDGYLSWAPTAVFEQAYREISDDEWDVLVMMAEALQL